MRLLRSLLGGVERIVSTLAGVACVAIMVVTCASAAARYLIGKPIDGAFEITTLYLMPALVWLGMSGAERAGKHIRVKVVLERLPEVPRAVVTRMGSLVAGLVVALVAASSVLGVSRHWGQTLGGAVQLPMGPPYLLVTAGAFLLAGAMLASALLYRGGSRVADDEPDDASVTGI